MVMTYMYINELSEFIPKKCLETAGYLFKPWDFFMYARQLQGQLNQEVSVCWTCI
jgi:hypothetical protein